MSTEFHVFTHKDPNYEQAFVFEVDRNEEQKIVEFKDLYMVTTTKHGELRTRVQFDQMIQSVICQEGGNVSDSSVGVIIDMFKDLIPEDKQTEINQEINDRQIYNMDSEELINASDFVIKLEELERANHAQNRGTTQIK